MPQGWGLPRVGPSLVNYAAQGMGKHFSPLSHSEKHTEAGH